MPGSSQTDVNRTEPNRALMATCKSDRMPLLGAAAVIKRLSRHLYLNARGRLPALELAVELEALLALLSAVLVEEEV